MNYQIIELEEELNNRQTLLNLNIRLLDEVKQLRGENQELNKMMEEWFGSRERDVFKATGYTKECGYPWDDGITFLETEAIEGETIAVDPRVVWLGSPVLVNRGYGWEWMIAEDIGAAVKGKHIDLYFGAGNEARREAFRWGVKEVDVIFQGV